MMVVKVLQVAYANGKGINTNTNKSTTNHTKINAKSMFEKYSKNTENQQQWS